MTTDDRFGGTLAAWLEEDARTRVPAHLAEVLVQTAATRQRRWWSSPERWLPVNLTATRTVAPRVPLFRLALLAVLLAVALVGLAVVAGSQRRLPPPFGLAGNGLVVHEAGGDIVALDALTGRTITIVGGAANDRWPQLSPYGTRIVFDREAVGGGHQLLVVGIAGGEPRPLGPVIEVLDPPLWSPDGTRLAVDAQIDGVPGIRVIGSDGTMTMVQSQAPGSSMPAIGEVQWRHDGKGLVFRGWDPGKAYGIWTVEADGTGLRPILPAAESLHETFVPALSPDGQTVAFTFFDEGLIRLVDVATGKDRGVSFDGSSSTDAIPTWSPDGTRIAFQRYSGENSRIVVAPATGGAVVETGPAFPDDKVPTVAWSPDGTRLIAWFPADRTTWLLDPGGGPAARLPIQTSDLPAWQRISP